MSDQTTSAFEFAADFAGAEVAGGVTLGPLETQYQDLFAEALEDGVITSDERTRLEKAADNLGLDRMRLARLEQAMIKSYESRHRVRVIEHYEEPAASLAPIDIQAAGDTGTALLQKRIAQLEGRIAELEEELRQARAQVNVEVDLSDLDVAADEASEDPEELWRQLRRDPTSPEAFSRLFRVCRARGDTDRAWRVAQALVALDAASDDERAVYEQHRSPTLITPRAGVSQAAWHDLLFHPEQEVLTGQIFGIIAPAVLVGKVTGLRRDKKLHQPSPDTKQDPETSTITAVRALHWAATVLGLAVPPIHVEKDRPSGYEHIPAIPPVTVVGKTVLSGRTQLEHAFLAGRHLAFYRQEHFVKTLFSSVVDLEELFLAALVIGSPKLPIAADMRERVTPIAQAIEPMLEPQQIDALRGHFMRFVEEGGRTNLQRWSMATEKTACRAGLLLGNDVAAALGLLEPEEGKHGELSKDLLVFATSDRYGRLRRQLGVAIEDG